MVQAFSQKPAHSLRFSRLAFPDRQHLPVVFFQSLDLSSIPRDGPCPLFRPELRTRRGRHATIPAVVRMPEAAMNEYSCSVFWQDNIRSSWEIPTMQSEPVTERMKNCPDNDLWFRVLPAYRGHVPASLLRRVNVCHALVAARSGV